MLFEPKHIARLHLSALTCVWAPFLTIEELSTTHVPPFFTAAMPTNMRRGMPESETDSSIDPGRVVGVKDALRVADAEWKRILQCRLEDVHHYGLAIMPYEEITTLVVDKAFPRAWPKGELQRYLTNLLRCDPHSDHADGDLLQSTDLYSRYADGFLTEFCLALERCCTDTRRDEEETGETVLWVYSPKPMELPCIRRLPDSIAVSVKVILKMLREYPSPGACGTFEEDTTLWVANRVDLRQQELTREDGADGGHELRLSALFEAWRREGYHEHLLRRYVWYRMIKQAPSRPQEVNLFVSQLFDKPWEVRRWNATDGGIDEDDFRAHGAR